MANHTKTQATFNKGTEHQVDIITDQTIEQAVGSEFDKTEQEKMFDAEAFMNERVTIRVDATTDENQPPSIVLNVNGITQPIIRGHEVPVRRMFVEVLARCKETKYKQPERNMMNPEAGNDLIGSTALTYPFEVIEDSDRGRAWLRAVRAEAA